MKNRRIVIAAFLCVAMLVMSVGYALVSNTLDIGGTGEIDRTQAEGSFKEDIYFSGVVVGGVLKADGVVEADGLAYTANINANNTDKAQFTVKGLGGQGESVDITFRVENKGDLDAELYFKTVFNSNPEYFDVKYFVGATEINTADTTTSFADLPKKTGADNSYVDITVRVTIKATPTDTQTLTTAFEFDAKSGS